MELGVAFEGAFMYYGEDIVEEVRQKTDIVDLVGQGIELFRPLPFSWRKDGFLFRFPRKTDFLLLRLRKGGRQHPLSYGI